MAGYDELRKEQAEKRAKGELMGIGLSFFTEGVGAGRRKHMDILGLGMADRCEMRIHPTGKAQIRSLCNRKDRVTKPRSRKSLPINLVSRPKT